ncbi:O-antigen ligase family protein [Pelagibacteraceae bacterium]|nr:O-antigen ligase family protein [Pelagibacteraceae bacterium]
MTLSKNNYLSILLALIPISFIAGNLIINSITVLLILSTIFFYSKELFKIKFYLLDKIIILFFIIVLLSGIVSAVGWYLEDSWKSPFKTILRSLLFFRYFLLYIVLRFLIENKVIDLKIFFITCALSSLFVSFDIFYQYKFGQDIFGFETVWERKLSGPFGDELIAGGFIQRFSLFSFFVLPLFFSNKSKYLSKYLIPILFIIFFTAIILSGNRMPLLLFVFSIFLIMLLTKQVRKYFLPFVLIFTIIFSIIFKFNSEVKTNFSNLHKQISKITIILLDKDLNGLEIPSYYKEFSSFYETWRLNKYIGGGIKTFRYYCHLRENIDKNSDFICNMHPHNYYLEILTETGLIGFFIGISIFFIILYISLFKKYFSSSLLQKNIIVVPFIFLFLMEIFPLRSTGSFFTTANTTYLFLIIGILIGIIRKENSIENKY